MIKTAIAVSAVVLFVSPCYAQSRPISSIEKTLDALLSSIVCLRRMTNAGFMFTAKSMPLDLTAPFLPPTWQELGLGFVRQEVSGLIDRRGAGVTPCPLRTVTQWH